MSTARYNHTATLLGNGNVLVAGGIGVSNNYLSSAEIKSPGVGWVNTGALAVPRYSHTSTLLPNGKVLVAGGRGTGGELASTEVYDPNTGSWSPSGVIVTGRRNHSATLLNTGKVLVAGGYGSTGDLASSEIYNPATGTWTPTGTLNTPRNGHATCLLGDGRVLVTGGYGKNSAEIYDPGSGLWSLVPAMSTIRSEHTATLLANGLVLVAGGFGTNTYNSSAELFNPVTGAWSLTGSLGAARSEHTATLLVDGTVLITGGDGTSGYLSSAELYNPADGKWFPTDTLNTGRDSHTATMQADGVVLVAGGYNGTSLSSAESYSPFDFTTFTVQDYGAGGVSLLTDLVLIREKEPHCQSIYKDVFIPVGRSQLAFSWSLEIFDVGQSVGATIFDGIEIHVTAPGTIINPLFDDNLVWSKAVFDHYPSGVGRLDGSAMVDLGAYQGSTRRIWFALCAYGADDVWDSRGAFSSPAFQPGCSLWVTSTSDSGPGSLREAIFNGNYCNGGIIRFTNVSGTIRLVSSLPTISSSLSIVGPGTNLISIDAGTNSRVLAVGAGTTCLISGLTISNGLAPYGGGVLNLGSLTLQNFAIKGCSSTFGGVGGGICNSNTLIMDGCQVALCGNPAQGQFAPLDGGAIYSTGNLTIRGSVIDNCHSVRYGGGIYSSGNLVMSSNIVSSCGDTSDGGGRAGGVASFGPTSLTACKILGCFANDGGGAMNCLGPTSVTNCLISGCGSFSALFVSGTTTLWGTTISDSPSGDGIKNFGDLFLYNCTVSGNGAYLPITSRGGIVNFSPQGSIRLSHCTIVSNVAYGVSVGSGALQAKNTIIAGNGFGTNDCVGTLTSQGYNLLQSTVGALITGDVTGNIYGVDPILGPLQDNGGPTTTRALLTGSPAIDHGTADGLFTDQRGAPRPFVATGAQHPGDGSDIGAYEFEPRLSVRPLAFLGNGVAQIAITGLVGDSYRVLASTNLVDWQLVGRVTNFVGTAVFIDATAPGFNRRFYRAAMP
jgi:hypothetical protein